ncbi:MAG: tRNA (adenosine(37)-N6)-dimethylallyltransferase MiaA, partial [Actinomycetota bacterium]|nr:tRNA (adenosine(37)-N6)-dimethylallyltransferase MiaA [Actinomycetota bacterium]
VRAALEAELADVGPAVLHARLRAVDPVAAGSILPSNGRRVVRALEVVEITGRPFSATMPPAGPTRWGTVQIGLDLDPVALDARVDARVARMFAEGLVDEVRSLAARGLRSGRTASRALGYQQILAALDAGQDPVTAAETIVGATRRLVRRQRSWFRRDARVTWFDAARPDLSDAVLDILTPHRVR